MVGVTKIGRGNAKYWIEAVAEGGEDYYTKPGEKPGTWMGDLAAELGLEGEVGRDAYFALLAGRHPLDGSTLVRRPPPRVFVDASGRTRRKEPILGHDIRFSAPKSVSLLWAIGTPEVQAAVEQALDQAVRAALTHMEREACFVQRGKGGKKIERSAGFVSMGFLHRSSRAGDPALHVHVVTANMTRAASDGRWLSLANPRRESPLLREAKATGYVFQAVLRAELPARMAELGLGVGWGPVMNGYADLEGFSRPLIDHFSRRRGEILDEMQRRGTFSRTAGEVAAYRTRDAKDYGVDPDRQRSEWRSRAAEFGLTGDVLDGLLRGGRRRSARPPGERDIDKALASLEATHSHFDRRDLLCAIADRARDGASARQLEAAVEAVLTGPRVVEIHRGEGLLGTSYYTTPRIWEMEQEVLASARRGSDAGAGVVAGDDLARVLARHRYLSEEQVEMVRRITTGGERIVTVAARPGTGKTTALRAAREAWSEAGVHGIGVATARSASGELADAGVPSMSITSLLIRCDEARGRGHVPLPRGVVILVDESSTTPTPDLARLAELAELCRGKLVLIGDERQIGAVGPGGLFGRLTTVTQPVRLRQVRRQRDPFDRRIVELAHEGKGSDAIDLLRTRERLVITDTLEESLDAMVLDWSRAAHAGEDSVMIARRLRDVAELNAKARAVMAAEGRLGPAAVVVGGENFAVGDQLVTRVNHKEVSNRERWRVVAVDSSRTHLKVRRVGGDGRTVVLSPAYLGRRTDNGDPAVQHAYALTTYATESKTFDSAFALLDAGVSREDFLVAISRARGTTTAYGVAASELLDADLGPATRDLEDEAHDIRVGSERVAAEFSADEVAARKRIEATPERDLVSRRSILITQLGDDRPSRTDPRSARVAELDSRIASAKQRIEAIDRDRDSTSGDRRDRHRQAMLDGAVRTARRQLERLQDERGTLVQETEMPMPDRPPGGEAERAELAMIEERLLQLRRRQVRAERISPSAMIVEALGPRPPEAGRASLWNEGVDLIVTHRQSRGLEGANGPPLGAPPTDRDARLRHREAERRLHHVQTALEKDLSRPTQLTR